MSDNNLDIEFQLYPDGKKLEFESYNELFKYLSKKFTSYTIHANPHINDYHLVDNTTGDKYMLYHF